jgi:hypothetical protein
MEETVGYVLEEEGNLHGQQNEIVQFDLGSVIKDNPE